MGFVSCKTLNTIPEIRSITFGSGGGFSNVVSNGLFLPNGNVTRIDGTSRKVSEKEAKEIIELANNLNESYRKPGNTYLYIIIEDSHGKHDYSWQFGDKNIDKDVITLYNKLIGL